VASGCYRFTFEQGWHIGKTNQVIDYRRLYPWRPPHQGHGQHMLRNGPLMLIATPLFIQHLSMIRGHNDGCTTLTQYRD
jgi:hypothetical protein